MIVKLDKAIDLLIFGQKKFCTAFSDCHFVEMAHSMFVGSEEMDVQKGVVVSKDGFMFGRKEAY